MRAPEGSWCGALERSLLVGPASPNPCLSRSPERVVPFADFLFRGGLFHRLRCRFRAQEFRPVGGALGWQELVYAEHAEDSSTDPRRRVVCLPGRVHGDRLLRFTQQHRRPAVGGALGWHALVNSAASRTCGRRVVPVDDGLHRRGN